MQSPRRITFHETYAIDTFFKPKEELKLGKRKHKKEPTRKKQRKVSIDLYNQQSSAIYSLPIHILRECLSFLGSGNYIYIASTSRIFRKAYRSLYWNSTSTAAAQIIDSNSRFDYFTLHLENMKENDILYETITSRVLKQAIFQSKMYVMEYAERHNLFTSELLSVLAKSGNLQLLKWAEQFDWPEWHYQVIFQYALEYGYLHVLKHLYALHTQRNGVNLTNVFKDAFPKVVTYGSLECVKYLHEVADCAWNESSTWFAVVYNHLHVLKYLIEEDCPIDYQACINSALIDGYQDVLEYLQQQQEGRVEEEEDGDVEDENEVE